MDDLILCSSNRLLKIAKYHSTLYLKVLQSIEYHLVSYLFILYLHTCHMRRLILEYASTTENSLATILLIARSQEGIFTSQAIADEATCLLDDIIQIPRYQLFQDINSIHNNYAVLI